MAPHESKTRKGPDTGEQSEKQDSPTGLPKRYFTPLPPGDEVVISGIAGAFPLSDSITELRDNLMAGKDLLTDDDDRYPHDSADIPPRTGKLKSLDKFDASFFSVHYKHAQAMDPMGRILLEKVYEAIIDAGVNPRTLRGTRMGIYIGASYSESEKKWLYENACLTDHAIAGSARAMLANRISYWLGVKGPSFCMDTACSSSMYALNEAFEAMRANHIDSAIVGGSNLLLHPLLTLNFNRLGVLSPRAICKPFDIDGDGYVRSETIAAVFLQRSKDARRIYARVINTGANCDGFKEQGITFPSQEAQAALMRETWGLAALKPEDVSYIEAHATGTKVGDPEEMRAIDSYFGQGVKRKDPVLVGSVKSNLGHSEPASAMASIAKVIIASEEGIIPPTIHYTQARPDIPALTEGRFKVVDKPTPWEGGIVAVNSFGFGGANAHVILDMNAGAARQPAATPLGPEGSLASLPRLVLASGRTREGVDEMLGAVRRHSPPNEGFIQMLHALHEENIPNHLYRGFTLAEAEKTNEIQYWSGERRPVWFVFSGMGSQWPGMGAALMRLPVFAAAMQRCQAALAHTGVDLINIITSEDPSVFDDILNCFVGIVAVQVGMVDVLKAVGIEPDFIIGHSVGEVCSGYADGCLTAEQAVLSAYYRGLSSREAKLIRGAMAAVGMSASELAPLCPPDVDIACHNSDSSATISGPEASLKAFVESLTAKNVFAREVACANIAYHSRYIQPVEAVMMKYLKQVIPNPLARSERWLSSSVPEDKWGSDLSKFCSAQYQTNNQLRPVLFEPLLKRIPDNAIVVEIGPHGLLQAILKRALSKEILNVPLAARGKDSLVHLLSAIGRMYNGGLQPRPSVLYPPPQWPVPKGTPMLSPLVRWAHQEEWFVAIFQVADSKCSAEREFLFAPQDEETRLWQGHIIDGRPLIPATAYLKMVWDAASNMKRREFFTTPVVFEDARFLRATHLPTNDGEGLELVVIIQRATGKWEVSDNDTVVASGRIRLIDDVTNEFSVQEILEKRVDRPAPDDAQVNQDQGPVVKPAVGDQVPDFDLSSKHVYKCLKLRGYNYQGAFRGIQSASAKGTHARIQWKDEWVPFLDTMLQMRILSDDSSSLVVPTAIQKVVIDPLQFEDVVNSLPEDRKVLDCQVLSHLDTIATKGIEIQGLVATAIARRRTLADPVLEHYEFVPFVATEEHAVEEVARVCVQLTLENRPPITRSSPPVRVAELLGDGRKPLAPLLLDALEDTPLVQSKATVYVKPGTDLEEDVIGKATKDDARNFSNEKNTDIVVLNYEDVTSTADSIPLGASSLSQEGTLIVTLPLTATQSASTSLRKAAASADLQLASFTRTLQGDLILHYKKGGWNVDPEQLKVIRVPELAAENAGGVDSFSWVEQLKEALKDPNPAEKRVVLVARGPLNGALGLFNCLRAEPSTASQLIRLYLFPDEVDRENATLDVLGALGLHERLKLDLSVNVLQGGQWGSMRHLKISSLPLLPVEHAFCNNVISGDLSSFRWIQGRINSIKSPKPDKVLVHVHYSSLNFRDIMFATGKLTSSVMKSDEMDADIGFEYAGRLDDGTRVMGMTNVGGIGTKVYSHPHLMWEVPDNMTLKEAATIPAAYGTVIFALDMVGKMQQGESVLIHAATGAVGQAAIVLALSRGCRVFATVGTQEKRNFLLSTFPQLNAEDIGNSRNSTFKQMVLRRTNGEGVDLVLNSLAKEKLQASLDCLGLRGRFLEIGKVDMYNNSGIGMRLLLKEVSIHGILLDSLINTVGSSATLELHQRLTELLDAGVIRPILSTNMNRQIFSKNKVEDAFRFMGAGKHIGKVLIAIREGEPELGNSKPKAVAIPACPRLYCDQDTSYVITGGLGGMGLELAKWLVERGARKLVLVSRRGVATGYQARRLLQWREAGVRTLVRTDDLATARGADSLLRAAEAFAPVAAIFNLAAVLRDAIFDNQTPESFGESFRCKASATVNLDMASRRLCPRLQHFVLFSSVSCGRGNAGQTNYGLSNSVMERVARARRAVGLPATAVQWGAVGDVGLVADMRDDDKLLEIGGTLQQKLSSCLETLDIFLALQYPVVASMVVAEKKAGSGADDLAAAVATLLGFRDLKTVSHESTLAELGMDSIISVEIQQMLGRDFDVLLTPKEVRVLTFARLKEIQREKLSKKSQGSKSATKAAGTTTEINVPLLGKEGMEILCKEVSEQQQCPRLLVEMGLADGPSASKRAAVLFPGVEGVASPLENLTNGIKRRVAALQLPFDDVQTSIQGIVSRLMPHVQQDVKQKDGEGYLLIGYSFGGLLALETAAQLEAEHKKQHNSHLILLDSAPDLVKTMVSQLANAVIPMLNDPKQEETFESRLQKGLLMYMLILVSPGHSDQQLQESVLKELSKGTKSLAEVFANVSTDVKYPHEIKTKAFEALYQRLYVATQYQWPKGRPKLQATVTLIRPKTSVLPSDVLSEDYGLSEICERPVRVLHVDDADHYTMLNMPTTISYVNSTLEEVKGD